MFFALLLLRSVFSFFFFNDTATTEIYTLSLHDALPICAMKELEDAISKLEQLRDHHPSAAEAQQHRSEEHTSELQSRQYLVCRLLLEKKKKKINNRPTYDRI